MSAKPVKSLLRVTLDTFKQILSPTAILIKNLMALSAYSLVKKDLKSIFV